jgi:MOSC domain-containing protein YiiM
VSERQVFEGEVVAIHVAPGAGEPMRAYDLVALTAGKGIDGDRYASGVGTYSDRPGPQRQVTLIEAEAVAAVEAELGVSITYADTRRNVTTRGVPLNHLVERDFTVGDVRLRGIKLCEPCGDLQQRLGIDRLVQAFAHRAGLNAEVLTGGELRVGSPVRPT